MKSILDLKDRLVALPQGVPYREAQEQSRLLDEWLEVKYPPVLPQQDGHERWERLDPQAWMTPYIELAYWVQRFPGPSRWLDVGAGVGRLGWVLAALEPQAQYRGIEISEERVLEGLRIAQSLGIPRGLHFDLQSGDVTSPTFDLRTSDIFFIFDFGSRDAVHLFLDRLREPARDRPITVIARGRGARHWIMTEHPWLAVRTEEDHGPYASVFFSTP